MRNELKRDQRHLSTDTPNRQTEIMALSLRCSPALSVAFASALLIAACGGGDGDSDGSADASTTSDPTAQSSATSALEPTVAPTTTPPPTKGTRPATEPGWTSFTTSHGLPGDDVVSIDIHADGTTWALIALDRDERGTPTTLALSRYEDNGWTSVEPPVALDGAPRLRAGPDSTAWIIGLEASADCGGNHHGFGPTGLWHFDGTEWSSEQAGVLSLGDRVAYDGKVDPEGTLWTVGISQIGMIATSFGRPYFEGSYAVSSFDGQGWTDVAIPDHFFYGLDCQRLFLDDDGTVWLDWADAVLPEGGGRDDFNIHARLDGETWTQYENPFKAAVGDPNSELAGSSQRTVGSDGRYAFLIIGDLRAFGPGLVEPTTGDIKPIGGVVFDGVNWGETFAGEITITEGHTIKPYVARGEGDALRGDLTMTTALVGDTIYLTGLGGLITIDPAGLTTTLTTNDGLVSNATHHVTATRDGVLWVATEAGISRYVPASS